MYRVSRGWLRQSDDRMCQEAGFSGVSQAPNILVVRAQRQWLDAAHLSTLRREGSGDNGAGPGAYRNGARAGAGRALA